MSKFHNGLSIKATWLQQKLSSCVPHASSQHMISSMLCQNFMMACPSRWPRWRRSGYIELNPFSKLCPRMSIWEMAPEMMSPPWQQADEIEKMLCRKFSRFMMRRAENFRILRRKAIEGYDIRDQRDRENRVELGANRISLKLYFFLAQGILDKWLSMQKVYRHNLSFLACLSEGKLRLQHEYGAPY